jgi:hypothetical protein
MIRSAQLRVYMPVERVGAFASHLFPGRAVVRSSGDLVWAEPTTNDAFTVEWRGATYVCPRYPRLRMLEGIVAFWRDNPGSSVLSELAARRATQELVRIRAEVPEARSYIRSAAWHVPLRWFVAFDPSEREMYTGAHGPSIRYRTRVRAAVRRVARSIRVLDDAGFDDSVLDDVRELERWLREFAGDGMLELDYHDTARLFDGAALVLDQSAAEIGRSLDALERYDYEEAGLAYAEVAARWAPAQALSYVN